MSPKKKSRNEVTIQNPGTSLVGTATPLPPVVTTAPISPPGALPGAETSPSPPTEWRPTPTRKVRGFRGLRPKQDQITNATASAKELQSSTTYVADFGATAPDPMAMAYTLTNASKWRDQWAAAKRWMAYCGEQRIAWENEAMTQMNGLQPPFDYAVSRNQEIARKYRATARFMDTTKVITERGVATRRANKAAKKKAEAQSPPTSTQSSAASPPVVTAAAAKNTLN